jgi:AraC family transcriptional regulator of adaptative response/methylated-DNA-[protein]-cysteine methyltransferase
VITYDFGQSTIAAIAVAQSLKGVVAILIRERPGRRAFLATLKSRFPNAELRHDPKALRAAIGAIVAFVENPKRDIGLPLDIRGTAFQRRVWQAAMRVPFGQTTTFTEVAHAVGSPRAVRAVGTACTRNPLEFAIPCHRVLRSDGSYSGGSAWGDRRQATIVAREAGRTRTGKAKTTKLR